MKANTHPNYTNQAKVTCVCGNTFITGSTLGEIRVEICSQCHPLYTGQQKLIDTQGQVEKYLKTQQTAQIKRAERAKIVEERQHRVAQAKKSNENKTSLKDLLIQAKRS